MNNKYICFYITTIRLQYITETKINECNCNNNVYTMVYTDALTTVSTKKYIIVMYVTFGYLKQHSVVLPLKLYIYK